MSPSVKFYFDYVFPNFTLPNATLPELGVMNYLMSMHSEKASNATFFEQQLSVDDVFDGSLGNSANSRTGFFYQAQVYSSHISYIEDSVYFGNRFPEPFIYPIKPNPNIMNFMGVGSGPTNRLEGAYFWKYISKGTLRAIKEKRAFVFIDYSMEPFIDRDMHEKFHQTLAQCDIPAESIYLCVNSFNAQECYEKWFPERFRKYNVRNLPFCLDHSAWFYNQSLQNNQGLCMNIDDFQNTRNTIRPNHYLMKMRNPREHRLALIYKMVSNDLMNFGDWSFLPDFVNYSDVTTNTLMDKYSLGTLNNQKIEELYKTSPHYLQSEQDNHYNKVNAWTDSHFVPHLNSYFEICFETFIHGDHKSLTEKVFKPIINFQPFIFVAYPGALSLLRDLGFKTFSGFIDESYDDEINMGKKMNMIYGEIKRLCSMSKEEIHNWYWSMEEILIHNHELLRTYNEKKIFGLDLMNEFLKLTNPSLSE